MLCWWSGASYYIKRRRGLALFCGGPQQKAASRVESSQKWVDQSKRTRPYENSQSAGNLRVRVRENLIDLQFYKHGCKERRGELTFSSGLPLRRTDQLFCALIFITHCLPALMLEWIEWKPPPMMNRGKDCNPLITAHLDHTTYGQVGIGLLNYLNTDTIDPYRLL